MIRYKRIKENEFSVISRTGNKSKINIDAKTQIIQVLVGSLFETTMQMERLLSENNV